MFKTWSIIFALAIFITGQILVTRFVASEQQRDLEQLRFTSLQELATLRARLEGLVNANLMSMRGLRA
ncbi:MAG: hypothetical protein JJU10_09010 [Idiomarina sp.]|nr:hypothetical protein [Idiomarina sp.]